MDNAGKWGIIIQARTGSTRLPRKMVLPFYDGKGVFELLLQRIVARFAGVMPVVVATTGCPSDDILVDLAGKVGASVFRGDEADVLGRFIGAARRFGIANVVRVCADNPFLDMDDIKCLVDGMDSDGGVDYITYARADGTPAMKTHYGFWAEAVRLDALQRVAAATSDKLYHEHVTNYVYSHPEDFNLRFLPIPHELDVNTRLRLTLDTEEDFKLLQTIYAHVASTGNVCIGNVIDAVDRLPGCYEEMEKQIRRNSK